jgi:hypothetical protein
LTPVESQGTVDKANACSLAASTQLISKGALHSGCNS